MLGKAVKFRHCPATVSAPVAVPSIHGTGTEQDFSQAPSAIMRKCPQATEVEPLGSALGRRLNERKSGDRSAAYPTAFTFRGERRSSSCRFPISCAHSSRLTPEPSAPVLRRPRSRARRHSLSHSAPSLCLAASIRGVVTDATGAKVTGASISLMSNGKVIASAVSTADGSFEITTGTSGRFFLVVSAQSFRQLQTPDFYAGQFDSIERSIVLEPAWVRESIVVTATGTPTPQPQTSAATTVLGPLDLATRDDLTSVLRLMPGTFVVQIGQLGAQASLFIRGGDSDNNKVLVDGVDAGDLGGPIQFRTALHHRRSKAQRSIADPIQVSMAPAPKAASSASPHPTAPPASLPCSSRAMPATSTPRASSSKFAGAHKKLDYLGAYQLAANRTTICPTMSFTWPRRRPISAGRSTAQRRFAAPCTTASPPPAFPTHGTFITSPTTPRKRIRTSSPAAPSTTRPPRAFTRLRYGLTRKREQEISLELVGRLLRALLSTAFGPGTLGNTVTITGANGYSATGQAVLDCESGNTQIRLQMPARLQPRSARLSRRHHHHSAPDGPHRLPVRRRTRRGARQLLLPARRTLELRLPTRRSRRLQGSLLLLARRQPRALFALRCSDSAPRRSFLLRASPAQRRLQRHAHSVQLRRVRSRAHAARTGRIALQLPGYQRRRNPPSRRCTSARSARPRIAPTRAASNRPSSATTSSSAPATFTMSSASRLNMSAST